MAGNPTSLKGVRNNTQIRIGVPMRAYVSAENAINRTNPSVYWIPVQEAIAWATGGFTAQEQYWPAVTIKFNLAGETGYWASAWINTNDNIPLATPSTVTCGEYTVSSSTQSITLPITVTTHESNVTHDVQVLAYNRKANTWPQIKLWSNVAANQTWSLTAAERNALLDAFHYTKSDWIRIIVKTKLSGEVVGERSVDAIVNVTYSPSITLQGSTEGNTALASALTGSSSYTTTKFLKNQSVVAIKVSSSVIGTSLKNIKFYYDAKLITTHTFAAGVTSDSNRQFSVPAGTKAGSIPLRFELEDNRGNTLHSNMNVTVLDYKPVSLTNVQIRRASNTTGTLSETGTYFRLDCNANWSKATGYGTNTAKVYVRYREVGQTAWTTLGEVNVTNEAQAISQTFAKVISAVKSYEVNVYMRDKVPELQSSTTLFVGTQKVPFSIGKDIGVGVGKIHEAGALDIASIQDNRGGVAIDGVLQDPWPWLSSMGIIPAGTNFNNLKDGKHFFYPDAGPFTNAPNTGQGMLISQTMNKDGLIIKNQQLWSLEGLTSRHHQQGTWFPWTKFYTDLDPPTTDPSDIQAWVTQQLNNHAGVTSGVHGIPANAKFTDTTYTAATTSAAGLMSATDKTKLNGIAAGAQVNPGAATTSAAGLMSAADKTKLNGIAAGAQVNPTKVSQLTNDSGFQTAVQVASAINSNVIGSGNASGVVFNQNLVNDSLYILYTGRDASMYVVSTSSGVVRIRAIAEMANAGSISTTGGLNFKIDFSTRARPWILTKVL